jgi:hypothetical protein
MAEMPHGTLLDGRGNPLTDQAPQPGKVERRRATSLPVRRERRQRLLDRSRLWPLFAGGRHAARDTAAAIAATGFTIEHRERLTVKPCPAAARASPHLLGVARAIL